jgi:hypothetical protein
MTHIGKILTKARPTIQHFRAHILLVCLAAMLVACPAGMSVYDHMRNVLSYQDVGTAFSDAIVKRWMSKQTDEAKKAEVQAKYDKIKLSTLKGIAALEATIDTAENAGTGGDPKKLREDVKKLVAKLLDFGLSLESAITPVDPLPATPAPDTATPASAPNSNYLDVVRERNRILARIDADFERRFNL